MVWPGLVTRQQVFLAAKTAIAAGLAWVAALAADPHSRPYFAPLAVLLVVQPTVYDSLSRAFQRVAGVVVGVAAALAVSHFLAPSAWSEALLSGERIAIYTRSMARALVDGSGNARPMPALSAMLAKTAAATEAYTAWVASADTPADRRLLATAVHAADDTLGSALARVQERWGNDPAQWLTFGMTLAMSQRILAEVGRPLHPAEREPA